MVQNAAIEAALAAIPESSDGQYQGKCHNLAFKYHVLVIFHVLSCRRQALRQGNRHSVALPQDIVAGAMGELGRNPHATIEIKSQEALVKGPVMQM